MKPDIMALSMSQSGTQLKRENSDALLVVNEEKRLKLEDCAETVPAVISNDDERSPTAMISAQQNETSSAEATRSRFECLPTELFNNIHSYLTPSAVVAMKFVSRDFDAKSRSLAGTRMVDIRRGIQRESSSDRVEGEEVRSIARIIIDYESRSLVRLSRLTCFWCARAKGNTLTGFSDDQFDQKRRDSMCLKCVCELHRIREHAPHFTRIYAVQGVTMAICYRCRSVRPASQCVTAANTGYQFCTNCWWRNLFWDESEDDETHSADEEEDEGEEEETDDAEGVDDSGDSGDSDDSANADGAAGTDGLDD